ncbi:MAG: adenylyltransferase/cytidyltransferase family protein, partial [Mariprofundales bacterium]|nr:adenylyltransferase/cytidyltransferase family protein [Mariprofundales bacterium]
MKIAVYPGTFDPISLGHVDVVQRGLKLFDHIVVGVATNPQKRQISTLRGKRSRKRCRIS